MAFVKTEVQGAVEIITIDRERVWLFAFLNGHRETRNILLEEENAQPDRGRVQRRASFKGDIDVFAAGDFPDDLCCFLVKIWGNRKRAHVKPS